MTKSSGNATLSTFEDERLASAIEVYCCGAEGGGSAFWPHIAWFCEECGELWKREVYDYHFDYCPRPAGRWKVSSDLCPKCTRRIFAELIKELE